MPVPESRCFRWRRGSYVFSSPAIAGTTAYFGTFDGRLRAVDLKAKAYSGEFESDSRRENGAEFLAAAGGWNMRALYSDNTLDAMFVGISRMLSPGTILSSPVIDGGVLFVGSADGNVYAIR